MSISNTSLRSDVWETVFDLLDAATLAPSTINVTITAGYIDDIQRFPQVVLYPVDVKKDNQSLDWSTNTNHLTLNLDIFAKKAEHLDIISDAIDSLSSLKSIQGLSLTDWSENNGVDTSLSNKLHVKTIVLVYSR